MAAAPVTVETFSTRCTASAGKVGFCEPKVPPAWAMMRLVPSWASCACSSPLALSVSPTALTMAATPMIGPEHDHERPDLPGREAGPGDPEEVAQLAHAGDVLPVARRRRSRRRAWRPSGGAVSATVGSWVTMTTARSGDSRSWKISSTWAALTESSAPVGSSARIMSGSVTMARASATRCCSPPDICTGRWSARAASPRRSSAAVGRLASLRGRMSR